ncbi:thioesterase domain-containing protein [Leptothoe spongobia TAU-MAC 1115]|uniref:Thioesterase domain-containing protein n=2 Tax=Leptothoe TaxID=2651725 RepID=A0A947GIC4_9CYAN|nr:thioesterase domain-containing protein [Leptothoe spongobia TAU-MAC 1115]
MALDRIAVEQYLHEHIPLSKAMEVTVTSIDQTSVILSAPLAPNINHRNTVFGGSISTLAILSAWTFVHVRLQTLNMPSRIVIQSNSLEYTNPALGDFQAHCLAPDSKSWQRFINTLSKHGKGRITLSSEVYSNEVLVGKFQGKYVALKPTH